MEIIKQFETYIAAQKATGMQIVIFGCVLLAAAILIHFSQLNPITQGLRNGFFVISMLLLTSGIGFNVNQNKLLKEQKETYYSDQHEFKKQELVRMQKVNKSVPNIIIGLSILIIMILLAFMFFIKASLWQGVTFSILIYLLGLLIFESISYISVKNYLQSLLT
jgi:hypothetical protein